MKHYSLPRQRGSSLIISLVILTAITLGAMVAMQRSTVQIRMIGNLQQQQSMFNAAYGDISNLFTGLRNGNTANRILGHMIDQENQWIAAGSNLTTKPVTNPYNRQIFAGLLPPSVHNSTVGGTQNQMRVAQLPGDTPNSLKMHAGSSTGTLVPYYFTTDTQAWDINNAVRSRQQAGFYILGPAPQN